MTAHRKRDCAHLVVLLTLAMYPGCRPAPSSPPRRASASDPGPWQSAFELQLVAAGRRVGEQLDEHVLEVLDGGYNETKFPSKGDKVTIKE